MWEVLEEDLAAISIGAAAMGTGGGGNAYLGMIHLREQLRSGLRVRVVAPDEVEDDWFLVAGGFMGAPVVTYEKLRQGREDAGRTWRDRGRRRLSHQPAQRVGRG